MSKKYQCYKDSFGRRNRPRLKKMTEDLETHVFSETAHYPRTLTLVWEKLEKYFEVRVVMFLGHGCRIVHNGMSTAFHTFQYDAEDGNIEFYTNNKDDVTLYFHCNHDNPIADGWYWTKTDKDGNKETVNSVWNEQVYFWFVEFFDGDKEQYAYTYYGEGA